MAGLAGIGLLLIIVFAMLSSDAWFQTTRYLDGHADAGRYELAIRTLEQAEALQRMQARHATARLALVLGTVASCVWATAWCMRPRRYPQAPPPRVLDGTEYKRIDDWHSWESK